MNRKKKVNLLLTLLLVLSLMVIGVGVASSSNIEGYFTYTVSDGKAEITDYSSDGPKDVVIPEELGGYSVTGIGENAFSGNDLTSVSIPDSVTVIGGDAFSSNQLTEATIGASVTDIGAGAFSGNQLTSIVIPESVTDIRGNAFSGNALTSVTIGQDVNINQMSHYTMGTNTGFRQAYIANDSAAGVYEYENGIWDVASYWGEDITATVADDTLTLSGTGAMRGFASDANSGRFSNITHLEIEEGITSVGENAFSGNDLTSVSIPDSVTSIGARAFSSNELTSVSLPDSVTSLGDWAFWSNQLTSASIGTGITEVGAGAFSENQLTSIVIPDSVTVIGGDAFSSNQLTEATIGISVTDIGAGAFSENQLTSIVIPDSVTDIGGAAFRGNALTSVTIGQDVSIGFVAGTMGSNEGFRQAYIANDSAAGVYEYKNGIWVGQDQEVFTVTFDSQGGSEVKAINVVHGTTVAKPADPIKKGYTFTDWYKEASIENVYDFNTPVTANITLYARWTEGIDECFIATAAHGSKLAPGVVILRQFRDAKLLTNSPGRAFVSFYYQVSPPIAEYIAGNSLLKAIVRTLLLPVAVVAYLVMQPWLLILSVIIPMLTIYYRRRMVHS